MNIQLSLKKIWFEMTDAEIKKEDYRAITPYFCNKFLLFQGEVKSKKWWLDEFFEGGVIEETAENIMLFCTFRKFDINIMTCGYPSKLDSDKIVAFEHEGIEIREGNPDWGAKEGVQYFVIKHGKRL